MIKKCIINIFLLMLASCQSTTHTSTEIDANEPLKANEGIVAVQIINNAKQLHMLHKGWTEIFLVRTDNVAEIKRRAHAKAQAIVNRDAKFIGKPPEAIDPNTVEWSRERYSLTPQNKGVLNSQIFVGSIPAGEYIITSLYSLFEGGDYRSWLTMDVMKSAGKFEVKEKQLTNLGSIVFQPLENINKDDFWHTATSQKAYVTRIKKQQNLNQFILNNYPTLANQLNLEKINTWLPDAYDQYREQLSDLSRENAYGDQTIPLSKYGKGMITAKFGLLNWQDIQGQWHKTQLETNAELASALELENKIIVGGELGQLFSGTALDGEWKASQPVPAQEAIVWLGKGHTHNYALTRSHKEHKVYTFNTPEEPWVNVYSSSLTNKNTYPIIDKNGELILLKGRKRYQYDKRKNKWDAVKIKNRIIDEALQLPSGIIVATKHGFVKGQMISTNDGKSWKSLKLPTDFFELNGATSLPSILNNQVVTIGSFDNDLKIISANIGSVESEDAWEIHHNTKTECTTMLPNLTKDKTLYFLCDQGDIVETSNYGKTWKVVMSADIIGMRTAFKAMH